MRLPGKTTRILRHTDGTRHVVTTGVTVGLTTGSEVVTLDGAGIALTNRDATHVDLLTDSEDIDTNDITSLQGRQTIGINAEFLENMTRFDTSLGEVAGSSLIHATGTPNTEGHLDGGIAIRFSRLIWVTRLLDTSSTVTGMEAPSSAKMRVMPTLRPTRPRLILFSLPWLRLTRTDCRYKMRQKHKGRIISALAPITQYF
jgi:hypothetical protein